MKPQQSGALSFMIEQWKPVVGYEGQYEVSNLGEVRSLVGRKLNAKLCRYVRKDGYIQVQLKVNQQPRNFLVHRLVASAFLPKDELRTSVNHKNFDRADNRLENLEFCTSKENVRHAWAGGRCSGIMAVNKSERRREQSRRQGIEAYKSGRLAHLRYVGKPVILKNIESGLTTTFRSVVEAAKYLQRSPATLVCALKGRQKSAAGHHCSYATQQLGVQFE